MISSLPWSLDSLFCLILDHLSQLISSSASLYHFCTYHNPVTFLFPALSRIPSANPTASFRPTPPSLFCLKLLIDICLHSHHPLFHFISAICYQLHSRLLLVNLIIVIYMHRGYFFMFCYFYLVFYIVNRLRVFFF